MKLDFSRVTAAATRFWRGRVGRVRTSTVVLIVAFIVLSWLQQQYRPEQTTPQSPDTQVVPPGFVPDPDYTWVPRTNLQTPRTTMRTQTPQTTETTTPTTESSEPTETSDTTETTIPGMSTTPTTTPSPGTPRTTVTDPDGPGLLPPTTVPVLPGRTPAPPVGRSQPGQESVAPTLPR